MEERQLHLELKASMTNLTQKVTEIYSKLDTSFLFKGNVAVSVVDVHHCSICPSVYSNRIKQKRGKFIKSLVDYLRNQSINLFFLSLERLEVSGDLFVNMSKDYFREKTFPDFSSGRRSTKYWACLKSWFWKPS